MNDKEKKIYIFNQNNNASDIIIDYLDNKIKTVTELDYFLYFDELFVVKIVEKLQDLGYNVHKGLTGPYKNKITITNKELHGALHIKK